MDPEAAGLDIGFTVNGEPVRVAVHPADTLLETLREQLSLFSVRGSCGVGMCGACAVLVDGRAVSSCIMLTAAVGGADVVTSEGLVVDGQLNEVQQAFLDRQAFQCSYCIPGMVVAVHGCLQEHPDADVETVRDHLGGNLCRCGSYPQVLEAVYDLTTAAADRLSRRG